MAAPTITRITSKNLVVELLPNHAAGTHVQALTVPTDNSSGSFKVRVNGYISAAINFSGISTGSIDTAIQATTEGANLTAGGSAPNFTLTSSDNVYYTFQIEDDTGNGTAASTAVTTQGAGVLTLNTEANSFSYAETQESTDVSPINADSRIHLPTVKDATWEISLYEALQSYRHIVKPGLEGELTVYEAGKGSGLRYFVWNVLILEASNTMNQFEKVELDVSGRRQGAEVVPVGSYQA